MPDSENEAPKLLIVAGRPESEIAADLKARMAAALESVCEIMDETARSGLLVQWDALMPQPPFFRHRPINLRIVKHF